MKPLQYNQEYKIKYYDEKKTGIYLGKCSINTYHGNAPIELFNIFQVDNFYKYGGKDTSKTAFLAVTENDRIAAISSSRHDLIEYLRRGFNYIGCDYTEIKVGDRMLPREAFILECSEAGVATSYIETCLLRGYWSGTSENGGEIKICPQCNKIRKTSCCACGCGDCKTCGYRWSCMPPMDMSKIQVIKWDDLVGDDFNFNPTI